MIGKKSTILPILCLVLASAGLQQSLDAQRFEQPPEYTEYRRIMRLPDATVRLQELERLAASYPQSSYAEVFEATILHTKVSLAADLARVKEIQARLLDGPQGFARLGVLASVAGEIIDHPRLQDFEAEAASAAVLDYAAQGLKLAADPDVLNSASEEDRNVLPRYILIFHLLKTHAYLHIADAQNAAAAFEDYKAAGAEHDSDAAYALGRLAQLQGRDREALDHYLEAALDNHKDSTELGRALFLKSGGTEGEFEALLEARQRELPFKVQPYRTGAEWKGKAVLVELFTGSECPPCAGADIGLDALLEAFEPKSLAVLVYHLPIPRPDPMMNHATQRRAGTYAIGGTPTIFFDGAPGPRGGGPRAYGEMLYTAYRDEVLRRVNADPALKLGLSAELKGDEVVVSYSADKVPSGAGLHFALVQDEVKYAGANGILFHHMVVKEFITPEAPAAKGSLKINLTAAEAAAVKHVTDFEQARKFTFRERHTAIKRDGLRVVFFVQDTTSLKVHNAVVAAVK